MTTPADPPPPSERTRVEQLLSRLIQGHDAELDRLDRIRRAIEYAPLVMGFVLAMWSLAGWFLRAFLAR